MLHFLIGHLDTLFQHKLANLGENSLSQASFKIWLKYSTFF